GISTNPGTSTYSPDNKHISRSFRCEIGLWAAGTEIRAVTSVILSMSGKFHLRSPRSMWREASSMAVVDCPSRRCYRRGKECMTIRPIIVCVSLAVAACAQLPPTASVVIPPIAAGQARVWFYRDGGPYDGVGTPYLRMNDAIVGISEPGGASYRDVPAGPYHITVDSYGKDFYQDQNVQLASGQESYSKIVSLRNLVVGC